MNKQTNLSTEENQKNPTSEYDVGFKKPPKHTQFQPGQSGNPTGRPKGSRNISNLFNEELNTTIHLPDKGVMKPIHKNQLVVKQVVNKAANGDLRAVQIVLNEMRNAEQEAALKIAAEPNFKLIDRQILNRFTQRVRKSTPLPTAEDPQSTTPQSSSENNSYSTNLSKE